MSVMSFVFFGLMLIPLIVFLVWIIKKDRNKNYLGLAVLVFMAVVALYTIIKFDSNFVKTNPILNGKSQTPSYR